MLPAAICTAIAHRHRAFPRDRTRLEAAIVAIGAETRFGRDRDGQLVFRPLDAERRAMLGAAANPRLQPLAFSEAERRAIGFGVAPCPTHCERTAA